MIYCLSCEKYPKDARVIPYGSTFPIDTFKVRLITNEPLLTMSISGADVANIADKTKFAVGSLLYVISDEGDYKTYVHTGEGFELWNSPIRIDDRGWI